MEFTEYKYSKRKKTHYINKKFARNRSSFYLTTSSGRFHISETKEGVQIMLDSIGDGLTILPKSGNLIVIKQSKQDHDKEVSLD